MTKQEQYAVLAKLLPEKLEWHGDDSVLDGLFYIRGPRVQGSELLQLCRDAWMTLSRNERLHYSFRLREIVVNGGSFVPSFNEDIVAYVENATAEQRIEALAKVKGIKV